MGSPTYQDYSFLSLLISTSVFKMPNKIAYKIYEILLKYIVIFACGDVK